jgi:hypothetical protein
MEEENIETLEDAIKDFPINESELNEMNPSSRRVPEIK